MRLPVVIDQRFNPSVQTIQNNVFHFLRSWIRACAQHSKPANCEQSQRELNDVYSDTYRNIYDMCANNKDNKQCRVCTRVSPGARFASALAPRSQLSARV